MAPVLPLALAGIGALVALALGGKKGPAKSGTYTLDANLPPDQLQQVLGAIANEKDPQKLLMFATQMDAAGFPLAGNALRMRAAMLTPGAPLPDPQGLDGNMDPATRTAVLQALATESDPNKLMTFAGTIQLQFPIAAGLLVAKANALGGGVPSQAPQPGIPVANVPEPGPGPMPAIPALVAPAAPGVYVAPMGPEAPIPPPPAPPAAPADVVRPQPVPMPPPAPGPLGPPAPPPDGATWVLATNADVSRDGTASRYASLLSSPVGTEVHATYNGRLWKFRVISKTTDPGLTTYAKDVKGWVAMPSSVVAPVAPAPAPIGPSPAPAVSLTGVQQAAVTMANALNARGYRQADTGLYKAFQSAAGLGADGFPGAGANAPSAISATSTMGRLQAVLASAGLPMPHVPLYPWHSKTASGKTGSAAYDGVNAPTWAQWTGGGAMTSGHGRRAWVS